MIGHLDVLVYCAGTSAVGDLADMSEDEWDLVFDTSVKGVFLSRGRRSLIWSSHGDNAPTVVRLGLADGSLTFEIADRGPGFDAAATQRGMGLQIMQDRVDALEGELVVESSPGRGTTVTGRVPARALEEAAR